MSDRQCDELLAIYELADLLVQFRFFAEWAWCERPDAGESQERSTVMARLELIRHRLDDLAHGFSDVLSENATQALLNLADAAEFIGRAFPRQWRTQLHQRHIEKLADVEPEQTWERDQYLVEQSPFKKRSWKRLDAAERKFQAECPDSLRVCYEMSQFLSAEIYPTFAGGQRQRDRITEDGILATKVQKQLRELANDLVLEHPHLARLDFELPNHALGDPRSRIVELWRRIPEVLVRPDLLPGHLGLVLDKRRGEVRRGEKRVTLRGEVQWRILQRLERHGEAITTNDDLKQAWGRNASGVKKASIDSAIHSLRKVLRTLAVNIQSISKQGRRLADATSRANPHIS